MNEGGRCPPAPWRRWAGVVARACLALALEGCVVGPSWQRPAPPDVGAYLPPEPAAAPSASQPAGPPRPEDAAQRIALGRQIPAQWWGLFHSPRLDETLRQAIAASHSLAAARATLAQAQEGIVEARAALYPQADLGASARRGTSAARGVANLFSLGPSVSYSLDAFGGTRRRVEQQTALAEGERYQLAAAYLTLTGNVVTTAITIAATRFQIATVEDLIKNDQKNLDLVQREFDAGKVARSEVLTAAAQLQSDRVQLPSLGQQLSVARHQLAVLAGKAPGQAPAADFDIDELTLPDDLPLSLPSELVRRRPDILAAEAQLHADSAAIGVATAQLYPSITLSASLAQESLALASLFQSASRVWSVGSSLEAPLYRGGALGAQRRAAIDAYTAQLAIYQQTILQAFGQVADVLSALEHDAESVAASRRARDIAAASLALQRSSYAAGKTTALQLIAAENTYSEARLSYVRAVGQRLTDTAQLFIAAGGGWWNDDALGAPAPRGSD
jgi:NodT family efflux transporter outer membrane factor (OMF) lipoprotein